MKNISLTSCSGGISTRYSKGQGKEKNCQTFIAWSAIEDNGRLIDWQKNAVHDMLV